MKANPQPAGESLGDLIAATGRGDREAFARLYEATGGRTYAIALRILGHHDLAEEAMQDAFLALWEKADRYDPERGQAFAWIASIVRNRAIDRLRKHGERHHNIALADDVDSGQQSGVLPAAPPETQAAGIFECLDRLKNESREAILLVYYYGLSHDALAERLDAPLGTVKSWVRRGLLQLRDCLEE